MSAISIPNPFLLNFLRRLFELFALRIPPLVRAGLMAEGDTPPFGRHSLRHVGVSLWIKNGSTPMRVQRWAGHASIQTTWDIYGHLWRELQDEQAAASASERLLLG